MALNQSLTAALSRGYYPHSLKQIPSKGNQWYVIITKPEALRENKNNIQVRRSTGTTAAPRKRATLNLTVDEEFKWEVKEWATKHRMTVVDVMKGGFELVRQKHEK